MENLESKQTSLEFKDIDLTRQLFGERNNNLKKLPNSQTPQ
jgi:hypothetical protein